MSTSNREYIAFLDPVEILNKADTLKEHEKAAIEEINHKVTAAESFEKIVDYVFEATKDLFPCDRIAIAFLEDHGRRVVARAARTKYDNIHLGPSYSEGLHGSTLQEILQNNRIRIINDLHAYLESKPQSTSTELMVKEGMLSSLSCPLIVEERPIGFFFRNSKKPFAYGEHEVLLHVTMAERLSHAVEKAWRISQLSDANQAYIEMLSFASHELKSPLATIGMECDILRDGYFGEITEQQCESLSRMQRKVCSLIQTTDDYLSLARYEGGQLKISIVDGVDVLTDCIHPAIEQLSAQAQARKISIEIEPEAGRSSNILRPTSIAGCIPESYWKRYKIRSRWGENKN